MTDEIDRLIDRLTQVDLTDEQRVRLVKVALVNNRWRLFDTSAEAHAGIHVQAESSVVLADLIMSGGEALNESAARRLSEIRKADADGSFPRSLR